MSHCPSRSWTMNMLKFVRLHWNETKFDFLTQTKFVTSTLSLLLKISEVDGPWFQTLLDALGIRTFYSIVYSKKGSQCILNFHLKIKGFSKRVIQLNFSNAKKVSLFLASIPNSVLSQFWKQIELNSQENFQRVKFRKWSECWMFS